MPLLFKSASLTSVMVINKGVALSTRGYLPLSLWPLANCAPAISMSIKREAFVQSKSPATHAASVSDKLILDQILVHRFEIAVETVALQLV